MVEYIDTEVWGEFVVRGERLLPVPDVRTVPDFLDRAAQRWPEAVAINVSGRRTSYAELSVASRRLAEWLSSSGIRPGDRVAAQAVPSSWFLALMYATMRVGAVFVPVHLDAPPYQRDVVLADAEPSLVVVPNGVIVASDAMTCDAAEVERLAGETGPLFAGTSASPDGIALLLYTSGTSSRPKGVVCSHLQVCTAVSAVSAGIGYRHGDVVLSMISLAFDYGLHQTFLCAASGAELVQGIQDDAINLVPLAKEVGATVIPVVPTTARMLVALAGREPAPQRVRLITNTGEHLPEAVQRQLLEAFPNAELSLMYGLTECKRVSIRPPGREGLPVGSVGPPLPGSAVVVVDERGNALGRNEVGQVVVIGPHVTHGYWRDEVTTAARFAHCRQTGERVLFTGDLGHLDEDGELHVNGRMDSVYKRSGVQVSPREVEAAACDIDGVRWAVLVPPNEKRGSVLWAETALTAKDVLRGLRGRLQPEKVPDRCRVVECLPKTSAGKIDRSRLAERAGSDEVRS